MGRKQQLWTRKKLAKKREADNELFQDRIAAKQRRRYVEVKK